MSPDGVHPSDMFDDDPTIAAFAHDLTEVAAAAPMPVVGGALASVLEGGFATPRADVPAVLAPRRARRLRVAVGGVVFGLGVGGLGVAGALPDPVQKQVSRVADVVGVDLPDGTGEPTTTTPTTVLPSSTTTPPTTATTTPTTVFNDDHGDDGDDDAGSANTEGHGSGDIEGDDNDEQGRSGRGGGEADDSADDDSGDSPSDDGEPEDHSGSGRDDDGQPEEDEADHEGHTTTTTVELDD